MLHNDILTTNYSRHPLTIQGAQIKGFAAVLVPLFVSDEAPEDLAVLLTKRGKRLKTHKGEVCFPGGKRDPEDVDDIATALREAEEEIGLQRDAVRVLGRLPPVLSKHRLSVHPVIGTIPAEFMHTGLNINPLEVEAVFSVPLSRFLCADDYRFVDTEFCNKVIRIHHFDCDGYHVWGLTAHILIEVAKIALGREPEFEEYVGGHPLSNI